jgi:hypothetical protein
MNKAEEKTLQILFEFTNLLKAQKPPMAIQVNFFVDTFYLKANQLFQNEDNLAEKNVFARWVYSAFQGGGGLFNDYPFAENCLSLRKELYEAIQELQTLYAVEIS